ncbi:MAG: hypothetical protein WCY89_08330 [Flavobacteriaceae bacterium]
MKKLLRMSFMLFAAVAIIGCSKDESSDDDTGGGDLVGNPGNPRFNLQFTNPDNVDLDLYVETPNGTIIHWANPTGQGGTLDVDCYCMSCSQGPNENIYWENGTAPSGTYKYWVEYYGSCGSSSASSSFTLKVLKNSQVITTKTGTLSSGSSNVWTHVQD